MDEEGPRVVVDDVDEADDDVFSENGSPTPPPLSMLRSRRSSFRWQLDSDSGEAKTSENLPPAASFAKLVRTVQFIKKWARRAEREPDSTRDEFLDRFKMNGPSIDSAFGQSLGNEEEEDSERNDWKLVKFIKKKRHLILIWNPSGQWLYR